MAQRFEHRTIVRKRASVAHWSALAAILTIAAATPASSQVAVQSLSGCAKITKAGVYEVDALSLDAIVGDCFVIAAPKVVLDLNGVTINGVGSGAGVHIMAASAFVEGRGAVISGFADGFEITSPKAVAENFSVTNNTDAGVLLSSAKYARLTNFSATSNTSDGVRISKGSYNAVGGSTTVADNGRYGVWLTATSYNAIGGVNAIDNAIAGVYVGCSTSGPLGAACAPKVAAGTYNAIFDSMVEASSAGSQQYGVAIDLGDDHNRVTNINSPSDQNETYEFLDENANCGDNAWFGQALIVSAQPPGCIH